MGIVHASADPPPGDGEADVPPPPSRATLAEVGAELAAGVPEKRSKKMKKRSKITIMHCDIIKEDFWARRAHLIHV